MTDPELSSLVRTHAREQRQNGVVPERPFDEPWQARAFALAVTTVEQLGLPWDTFRDHLKSAVADQPDRPYWESWLAALEALTTQHMDAVGRPAERRTRLSSKAGGDRAKR